MRRSTTIFVAVSLTLAGVGAIAIATTPPHLTYDPTLSEPKIPTPDRASGLTPGTEQRIVWAAGEERTEWSVVYVHGFSATRQEIAPVAEMVAGQLGANLFETRLAGHGLVQDALVDVTAEAWLDDMAAALAAGAALGEKVIVIATSTGATLTTVLHDHPLMQYVDTFVFLSPNFDLRDANARHMTGPAGRLLTRLLAGETYSWTPANEAQGRYWATSYPTSALIEMIRLLDRVDTSLPLESPQRWFVIYSDLDDVVSPQAIRETLNLVDARDIQTLLVDTSDSLSHHVFTGDIMAPDTTPDTVAAIIEFIQPPAP